MYRVPLSSFFQIVYMANKIKNATWKFLITLFKKITLRKIFPNYIERLKVMGIHRRNTCKNSQNSKYFERQEKDGATITKTSRKQ